MGTIGYINIDIKRALEEDSWYILRFTPWFIILKRRGNEHTKFKIAAISRVKRKGCEKSMSSFTNIGNMLYKYWMIKIK